MYSRPRPKLATLCLVVGGFSPIGQAQIAKRRNRFGPGTGFALNTTPAESNVLRVGTIEIAIVISYQVTAVGHQAVLSAPPCAAQNFMEEARADAPCP